MTLRIRAATAADVDRIAAFNVALAWETEALKLETTAVRKGVAAVLEDAHKGRYFVAERDGEVVGQLMLTEEWSDWRGAWWWWIQSVYVAEEARRGGVYRALHTHARALAEVEGVAGIKLYVERHNQRAKATYQAMGMHHAPHDIYVWSATGDDE